MKRMGWFLRTLLGYFLLAALLLAGVGIPVSGNVRSLVYEEILSNAQGVLESVETVFADWIRGMEEYAYQVRGDVQMNPYVLQDDGYAALNAVRELSKTVTYSNACETIVLVYASKYFSGLPRVYTSQNYTDAQRYFAYFYRYDQWSLESLYAEMASIVAPVLRGPEMITVDRVRREAYMTYVVPLGASSSRNQRGVMLFLTPVSQLTAMLREINLPEEATLVLADAQGQVLLASGSLAVPQGFALPGEGAERCQVAGEACLLLQGSGEACGVRLALLLDEGKIAGMMRSRLTNILLILLAGLLLAVGASLVLSTLVFRPVRRLAGIARSVDGGAGGKQHRDEFEHIERTIRLLHANNADLLSRLHSQNGMLRQHLLRAMCLGQGGAEKFLALLREDGIAFSERCLRVLILRIDNEALFESRMDASLRALTRFGLLKVLRESMGARQIVAVGCEMGVNGDCGAAQRRCAGRIWPGSRAGAGARDCRAALWAHAVRGHFAGVWRPGRRVRGLWQRGAGRGAAFFGRRRQGFFRWKAAGFRLERGIGAPTYAPGSARGGRAARGQLCAVRAGAGCLCAGNVRRARSGQSAAEGAFAVCFPMPAVANERDGRVVSAVGNALPI